MQLHTYRIALATVLITGASPAYSQIIGGFQQVGTNTDSNIAPGHQIRTIHDNSFTGSSSDLALVLIGWETTTTSAGVLNGVTYDGASMTHLHTQIFDGPSGSRQSMALFFLSNPGDGSSVIEADFTSHPGWENTPPDGPAQLIFSNILDNIAAPPVVYDSTSLLGTSLTLNVPADPNAALYYDLVLHGVSWANYSWGAYPAVSSTGGQTLSYAPWYDGSSSLALVVGTNSTTEEDSHAYIYGVGHSVITGIGIKFEAVPEPSGALLLGLAGSITLLFRRRDR